MPGVTAPQLARTIALVVFCGYLLATVLNLLALQAGAPALIASFACVGAAFALHLWHMSPYARSRPRRHQALSLTAQAVVTYLPLAWLDTPWGSMTGFLSGSVLLLVEGWAGWALFAAVAVSIAPLPLLRGSSAPWASYLVISGCLTGLVVYGMSRLSSSVAQVEVTRGELARLAVMRERLRVARDLHDLLGFSLSAITLKSELTYRLLPRVPDRARVEVAEMLAISRQALADVRLVASGYREMSLEAEADSARSVLGAADIAVELEVGCGGLPGRLDTVLATVLREAVTNVLRHSRAQRCVIRVVESEGVVRLEVVNDGVVVAPERPPGEGGGSGLGNLTVRLEQVGGVLRAGLTDDGHFRVRAEIPNDTPGRGDPARRARAETADAPVPELAPHPHEDALTDVSAPRLAWLITQIVFCGFLVMTVLNVLATKPGTPVLVGLAAAVAAVLVLQLLHSSVRARARWRRRAGLTLGVQAVVTYVPLLWFGWAWDAVAGFLAGSLLLLVEGWAGWALFAAVVAAMVPLTYAQHLGTIDTVYTVTAPLLTGLVVYGMSRLSASVVEVRASRGELARLAVMRERLRVARDLHDLLGFSLSAITLKSELTYRLLPRVPDRARVEVAEMLAISRQALADVRLVASGYREMSLEAEADSARSVLGAADIAVELEVGCGGLPGRLDTVLATVLREAVTNVLRHSRAQRCVIRVVESEGVVRLEVVNDGVVVAPERPPGEGGGSGLGNLTVRLEQVGGVLRAGLTDDGHFRLTAEALVDGDHEGIDPGQGQPVYLAS
ncbi:histidine kinase [Streptomyces sp. NPDC002588]|uniref:sensor histidine kinase n=1 Tax=Streptomyces sp. NPDC002588 TaxID=3154419 RepID=UPI003328C07D